MKRVFHLEESLPWDMVERRESALGIQGLEQLIWMSGRDRA